MDMRIAIVGAPSPNYSAAVRLADMEPVETVSVQDALLCDGLILPGGADVDPTLYGQENVACKQVDGETDRLQLEVCRGFMEAGKPILGICKGHQLLNVCLGGTLWQDIPEEPRHGWNHGDRVHPTRAEPGSWLERVYGREFVTNSCHHQGIHQLGTGLIPIQYSDDGVLEGIIHESLPILGVQWHPERMCGALRREDTVDGLPVFLELKAMVMQHRSR